FISSCCPAPPGAPLFPYTTLFRSLGLAPIRRGRAGRRRHFDQVLDDEPAVAEDADPAAVGEVELDRSVRIVPAVQAEVVADEPRDRKSTRLNSSHVAISYAVFCLK